MSKNKETKWCKYCETMQPAKGFRGRKCLECLRKYRRQWEKDNKEEIAAKKRQYQTEHREEIAIKRKPYFDARKEEKAAYDKLYREKNKEKKSEQDRKYYQEHREPKLAHQRQYNINNKERIAAYQKQYAFDHKKPSFKINKECSKIKEARRIAKRATEREYRKRKSAVNPVFKLKCGVSSLVNRYLKLSGGNKNGLIRNNYFPYSDAELRGHLEKQFEPWMNWNNHGKYDPKTWDDNDPSTWKWQLDHIIPQSDLPSSSPEEENFKKCWALENLRPLSAKQNILDGIRKTRHKKKN
jgi:hypothetical protein